MNTNAPSLEASAIDDRIGLRAPLGLAAVVLLVCGLAYSAAGTLLGGVLFPDAASGSLLSRGDRVVASTWVAQPFDDARYFHPRPSAAHYDPTAAAGSNAARSNPDLRARIAETTAAVAKRDGIAPQQVPGELVTASGSGLDPHLSPAAARVQVRRVAMARGLEMAVVERLLDSQTEAPQFGVLGEPRVNVLALNLALDALPAHP